MSSEDIFEDEEEGLSQHFDINGEVMKNHYTGRSNMQYECENAFDFDNLNAPLLGKHNKSSIMHVCNLSHEKVQKSLASITSVKGIEEADLPSMNKNMSIQTHGFGQEIED